MWIQTLNLLVKSLIPNFHLVVIGIQTPILLV